MCWVGTVTIKVFQKKKKKKMNERILFPIMYVYKLIKKNISFCTLCWGDVLLCTGLTCVNYFFVFLEEEELLERTQN